MKPVLTRLDRDRKHADAGIGAARLMEDDHVQAFFDDERNRLTEAMISVETLDDDSRRGLALEIKALDKLRKHLEALVPLGRKALENLEKNRAG
jgi:hypothetical protein